LEKRRKHEEHYGAKDGQSNFFNEEYARKQANLVKQYQRIASGKVDTSADAPVDAVMLASNAASIALDDAWMSMLTPEQQQEYEKESAWLEKRRKHEEHYGAKDGQSNFFNEEYARKQANLVKQYQRIASGKVDTSADAVMLGSEDVSSAMAVLESTVVHKYERLASSPTDQKLEHTLVEDAAFAQKQAKHAEQYAATSGVAKGLAHKEADLMSKYKQYGLSFPGVVDEASTGPVAPLSSSPATAMMVGMSCGGLLSAIVIGARSMLRRKELEEPIVMGYVSV